MKKANIHFYLLPLFLISCTACYHGTIVWWYTRCASCNSYYSHGFLIPLIAGYLIWQKRRELAQIEPESSVWGLLIFILSLLLHLLGTIVYIYSISGFSIVFLVMGAYLFLFGWKRIKMIAFPLVFLVFMIPLPLALLQTLSFPLKLIVAEVAAGIVSMFGIPVFREGFYITIPSGILVIGSPCSGLRSLISFLALGAILAHMVNSTIIRKFFLFLCAIPIAVFSNFIRVSILILISTWFGIDSASPGTLIHMLSGIFVFVIGMILLFITGKFLET